jgi:hypothetical protein
MPLPKTGEKYSIRGPICRFSQKHRKTPRRSFRTSFARFGEWELFVLRERSEHPLALVVFARNDSVRRYTSYVNERNNYKKSACINAVRGAPVQRFRR